MPGSLAQFMITMTGCGCILVTGKEVAGQHVDSVDFVYLASASQVMLSQMADSQYNRILASTIMIVNNCIFTLALRKN